MNRIFYTLALVLIFSSYSRAQLSGDRNVPSDDYPGLQAIADSLNLYGVGEGGVNFILSGNSIFDETSVKFATSGSADKPVNIRWNGENAKPQVNFTGTDSGNESGFILEGVGYYTIEGISITNTDSNIETGILIINASDSLGAHNNIIKNVDITLDKLNTFQTVGIAVITATAPTAFEGNNHNNKFYNNVISNVTIGYVFDGGTSNTEFMCVGNEVGIQDEGQSIIQDLVLAGVSAKDQNGFIFSNNIIRNITRIGDGNTAPAAIATSSGNPSQPMTNEFIISNNTIENMTSPSTSIFGMYLTSRKAVYHINNNKIHNITATGGGSNTSDGITLLGTDLEAFVYNNMISGIEAPATAVSNNSATRGINARTYSAAHIFYNTVVMDYTATHAAHISSAITIYNNGDPIEMRNNIFINKTILPDNATGMVTAVYKRTPALANILDATDNNIYYVGEPGPRKFLFYGHNASAPGAYETLEDYKAAASTFDQNSYSEDVPFISKSDLHIVPAAVTVARNNGKPVTEPIAVTIDFDGLSRDTETPDIGADEVEELGAPLAAVNPNPENRATGVKADLTKLSWEYYISEEHTTPIAFKVYFSDSSQLSIDNLVGTVLWEEGETSYSFTGIELDYETGYFWKVVPVTDLGDTGILDDAELWSFDTEVYIFPYPNLAENPNPQDGGSITVIENEAFKLGWDFNPSPIHTLPTHFEIYLARNTDAGEWQTPVAEVDFTEGQVAYEIEIKDVSNLDYTNGASNVWKVVPVAQNSPNPEAKTWNFTFDIKVSSDDTQIRQTSIYPNPASDIVHINPELDGKYEVLIYDIQGKLVKQVAGKEGQSTLNISKLKIGVYQLVIKQGYTRITCQLTVN